VLGWSPSSREYCRIWTVPKLTALGSGGGAAGDDEDDDEEEVEGKVSDSVSGPDGGMIDRDRTSDEHPAVAHVTRLPRWLLFVLSAFPPPHSGPTTRSKDDAALAGPTDTSDGAEEARDVPKVSGGSFRAKSEGSIIDTIAEIF
jgi:hypothetical protein